MSPYGKHTTLERERVYHGLNYKITTTTKQKRSNRRNSYSSAISA